MNHGWVLMRRVLIILCFLGVLLNGVSYDLIADQGEKEEYDFYDDEMLGYKRVEDYLFLGKVLGAYAGIALVVSVYKCIFPDQMPRN